MERMLKSSDIAEILQCSRDQALILMRRMKHFNISVSDSKQQLRVQESDFHRWLDSRATDLHTIQRPARRPRKVDAAPVIMQIPYRHTNRKMEA